MAFTASYDVGNQSTLGNNKFMFGTYTNTGGSTGGDIQTNLGIVKGFWLQPKAAAVLATQSVVNETFPLQNSNGSVTIVTSADEVGYWYAIGY